MSYLIYLFNSGESATVMNVPVAHIPSADITELSDELAREIYIAVAKLNEVDVDPAVIANWTAKQVAVQMWDEYTYLFDRVAVMPVEMEAKVEKVGDKLLNRMGGNDSDCYEAAGDFGDYLLDNATRVLEFPDGSEE